jgi:regulator of RNase E activity RraA
LKSTGLTRKTGEYFQCPVYFGISLVERTSKINGQIRTLKYFKGSWEFSSTLKYVYSNSKNSSVFMTGDRDIEYHVK